MKNRLSHRELDIMDVLWAATEPLSAKDILDRIPGITMNTIQPNLTKLMKKGFIQVTGIGYTKNSIARKFSAVISQSDYVNDYLLENTRFELASRFVESVTDLDELSELAELIEKKKAELA